MPKPVNPLTGQAEFSGTSIVDVTDAAHPRYLAHIPGTEGTYEQGGAQMVRVCDGKTLPKGDPLKTPGLFAGPYRRECGDSDRVRIVV